MEAAREIERLEGKLSDKASSLADAERKIERLESRIFDLEVELEQTS
jgi:archaellum component FlaC